MPTEQIQLEKRGSESHTYVLKTERKTKEIMKKRQGSMGT